MRKKNLFFRKNFSFHKFSKLLDDAAEDITLKRNLILSLVYRVRGLEHGKFAVDLILDGTGKMKIDITPDEVMSNGGDW